MRAVVGRMPLWARGENAEIETAMLTDSRAAEYRESDGADDADGQQGLKGADEVSGHEEIEGREEI